MYTGLSVTLVLAKRFTGAASNPGSLQLNYLTNKIRTCIAISTNCCMFQFSNDSDYVFSITEITE